MAMRSHRTNVGACGDWPRMRGQRVGRRAEMSTNDLHYLGLVEVGQQIRTKKLSPVEVTKAMLERIERLDGKLKSYAYVMADSALAEAAAAEKDIASGKVKGPL